jgi:hypothetical protein
MNNDIRALSQAALDLVSGGQDGGAPPPQVTKTTTKESTTVTFKGQAEGTIKKIVNVGAEVTHTETSGSTSVSTPCPPQQPWRGVPYR